MKPRSPIGRKMSDKLIKAASAGAALLGLFFLGWILLTVCSHGIESINWNFFTKRTLPDGENGGLGNAIVGTLIITALATAIGVPVGLLGGVYLAEFGRGRRVAAVIRFFANVLMGTPSIIIGVFAYAVVVMRIGYSAWAGAFALAIIMLPLVARTAEDMLHLVPDSLRESALALGLPRWRVTLSIIFRAAKGGLLTGCLLAVARVSGETAPLLFTALSSRYWMDSFDALNQPTPNLTVQIYNNAMTPYDDLKALAWGGSLLITAGVLTMTILARLALRWRTK